MLWNAITSIKPADLAVRVRKKLGGGFTLDAEFSAAAGFTILFGPSGAGKTTLLHCVAGLHSPDAGRVAVGSRVLFDSQVGIDVAVRRRAIGYLFQTPALFPHLTVEQNVEYGIVTMPSRERRGRISTVLESFRLARLRRRKPGEISGGERQRVALARSLVTDPEALLLDEPLSALDAATKSSIISDLREWNAARRIPILYVTHSPAEAFALGERLIVLISGKVLAQGTPQQVLDAPRHETIAQLADFENIFDATVTHLRPAHGTMGCRLKRSTVELEVPLGSAEVGSSVRIAIRAGDIIAATDRPRGLSARNAFQGYIVSIKRRGVTVVVSVEVGVMFEVHLTPDACEELRLESGGQVWLVIKTYSCHLVEPTTLSEAP
jgi:molybdate transport system ATP-binding protein